MVAGSEGGAGAAASSTMFKDRLLLDYLLASSTRKVTPDGAALFLLQTCKLQCWTFLLHRNPWQGSTCCGGALC
jgi:hypothetical protein